MRDKLDDCSSKMPFADRNDSVQTLFVLLTAQSTPRTHGVRRRKQCLHHANPGLLESFAHRRAPLRIPVAYQHAIRVRIGHRERPYDLAHKRVVRIWRGAKLSSAIIPAGSRGAHAATGSIPYT